MTETRTLPDLDTALDEGLDPVCEFRIQRPCDRPAARVRWLVPCGHGELLGCAECVEFDAKGVEINHSRGALMTCSTCDVEVTRTASRPLPGGAS